jgi:hypothetical protein
MDSTGFLRGYMAKNQKSELFFKHVITCIEQQLQEFNKNIKVVIEEGIPNIIHVLDCDQSWFISCPSDDIRKLQKQGPYALDRKLWKDLRDVGFDIEPVTDYLQKVL